MKDLIRRRIFRQLVKYGLIGIVSTIIDWSVYLLLTRIFHTHYIPAKIISFSSAVFNSYIWNRRWTFRSLDPSRAKQFGKFMIIALVGLLINAGVMILAVEKLHLSDIYALTIATIVATLWNFTLNKLWTFRD